MKSLTAITIISVAVMIMASAGYYFYNNSINESSYPSYHVDMHLNTTIPVPYYPIHVNSNLTGNGTYQQLLTISDPSHYGINANGSNLAFYDGSNNTHLYAWIQSINSTSMQVWVKNYNASNVIDMQVLPSFENLFNANGYLGNNNTENNGNLVFPAFWNGETSMPSWITSSSSSHISLTSNNPSGKIWYFSLMDAQNVVYFGEDGVYDSGYVQFSWSPDGSYVEPFSESTGFLSSYKLPLIGSTFGIEVNYSTSQFLFYNDGSYLTDIQTNSSVINAMNSSASCGYKLFLGNYNSSIRQIKYSFYTLALTMPTFTIGAFTNMTDHAVASYLSNSITIPMPNWFNLTLKAYTNYSFTFQYNNDNTTCIHR